MMIRSTFLVLVSFALAVSCYECNGTTSIEAPSDISQPTFYPSGWTDDQALPRIARGQGCRIDVNIPSGYYATVTFYKHFETTAGIYVYYSNRKVELLQDDDHKPYIFTSPNFKVNLGTNDMSPPDTGFAFKIVWAKFPVLQKNVVNIYKGNAPVAASASSSLTTFVGNTNSMMSIMAFALKDPSMNYLLRQTAIFGGDSVFDDYLGTLGQVLSSQQKLTTYGNKISVYTFGLNNFIDYPLFMAQDFSDTTGVFVYGGVNCPSTGNCNITLNGNWGGRSWTVTDFNGSEYIKNFDSFPDTATISVYENNISNTTCIATLTSANYQQQLPLEVKGTMKIYDVEGYGIYNMVVTRDASRASRH